MIILLALGCGILFGAGLAISGMINPQKVLAFLDVGGIPSGTWDPTLGVVFAAALVPMFVAYAIQKRMARPALDVQFEIPTRRDIDARLLTGAAIFGAGWGLAGLCPGPAIAVLPAAGSQLPALIVFIVAMLAGIWLSTKFTSAPVPEPERAPT
ncbi:MAG TPA: DUF6691 family protein [Hyphomicrobiaceae bacterium]|jgi:uncharacterized membrane protein YedE/YeeE